MAALPRFGITNIPGKTIQNMTPLPGLNKLAGSQTAVISEFPSGMPTPNSRPALSWPGYLGQGTNGQGLEPNMVINNGPNMPTRTVVGRLNCAPLRDDSQLRYDAGDLVFLYSPMRDVQENRYAAYTLWRLNYGLEAAARKRLELAKMTPEQNVNRDLFPKRAKQDRLDDWPTTVEEFLNSFSFAGGFNTSQEKPGVRTRNASIAYEGHFVMPTIFDPNERGDFPGTGDFVGLVCKAFENRYRGFLGPDGKSQGSATPGKFLQIRGYWSSDGKAPVHCTKLGEPQESDLDCVAPVDVEQTVYGYTPEGFVADDESGVDTDRVSFDSYQSGFYIPLGTVTRVNKPPSKDDIDRALRSKEGWVNLQKYSTVEIHMEQMPIWHVM